MDGTKLLSNFIDDSLSLFEMLKNNVKWDERMVARKTASFGKAYNYSQMSYPHKPFPNELKGIVFKISNTLGFEPNNCLLNYYLDGKSKMGYHSDQTDILIAGTGVVIVSLGAIRTLRFRNIADKSQIKDFELQSGSLFYMTNGVQDKWQHCIPKCNTNKGRISLTFRMLK